MNKTLVLILLAVGVLLVLYNISFIDWADPFTGNSLIALACALSSLCAVVLLLIYLTSKKIEKKVRQSENP